MSESHPVGSRSFYRELLGTQATELGAEMFFTDFLSYRGPAQQAYQDVPWGDEGEMLWLGGIALAAADVGMEVQFCMAAGHTIMQTFMLPAATNARVNGDGGLNTPGAILPILLAATVHQPNRSPTVLAAQQCLSVPLRVMSSRVVPTHGISVAAVIVSEKYIPFYMLFVCLFRVLFYAFCRITCIPFACCVCAFVVLFVRLGHVIFGQFGLGCDGLYRLDLGGRKITSAQQTGATWSHCGQMGLSSTSAIPDSKART